MTSMELIMCLGQIEDKYVMEAQSIVNPQHRAVHYGSKRWLLIAAIVAILLLLVGCTVGYFLYPAMMETILGVNGRPTYVADTVRGIYEPGGERTELNDRLAKKYIEPYILAAEGSISDGDTRLTVLSYIVDRTSCTAAVYVKVENPPEYQVYNNGMVLFDWEGKWNGWYIYPTSVGQDGFIGRCIIDQISTTEDMLCCVVMFSCEPECSGLQLQIGDVPDMIELALPEQTELPSAAAGGGLIRISPFGMIISSALRDQDDDPLADMPYAHELGLQFRDGAEYLIQHTGFGDEDYIGYTYGMALNASIENRVYIFNRVVDIEQVAAVRVNDHIYPVN